eukprot:gnl/MRDRNA2_/MRDRNA2_78634_c0_seq1.p1 gnl/MRDRNA2_/MRDRNA2_78634_c0~~gnl/MRDRNA2_/MRDRNA2_78634_c0_seq1.p1  ORF type:complete len:574 (-),score=90.64 gnl/MRDRNA2_/MRDRNA2_78634_c0_seq1:161-1882(-)
MALDASASTPPREQRYLSRSRSRSRSPSHLSAAGQLHDINKPNVPLLPQRPAFVTLASGAYMPSALLWANAVRKQLDEREARRTVEACAAEEDLMQADVIIFCGFDDIPSKASPGIIFRTLCSLELPPMSHLGDPMFPHFRFCWRKLGLWALIEYDAVVYMDADVLLLGDVTDLLRFVPEMSELAAVPACQCWCSDECKYTVPASTLYPDDDLYFNGGVLVFRPSKDVFDDMAQNLQKSVKDYPFAEQDFLNQYFKGRAIPLNPKYNSLKFAFNNDKHSKIINLESCVVLHFVMAKPWEKLAKTEQEFDHLHQLWRDSWSQYQLSSSRWLQWPKLSADVTPLADCLYYVPDFLSEQFEDELATQIHSEDRCWHKLRRRQLQCWGGVPHPDGSICEPLPAWLSKVAADLVDVGAMSKMPDQCLINSYSAHEGIDAHCDGPLFLPEVAVLSLEGPALLRFGLIDKAARPDLPSRFEILLRPRSLLVFRCAAYSLYVHHILSATSDCISGSCVNCVAAGVTPGMVLNRAGRRTSLTMRRLRNVKVDAKESINMSRELQSERASQWEWWAHHISEFD